jgi:putative phosphoribosyl transferase
MVISIAKSTFVPRYSILFWKCLVLTAEIIDNPAFRGRVSIFKDRFEAGKLLADELREYTGNRNVIVLAVPAGGVPVGYEVAKELAVPMDVVVVRKVQIPWVPEAGFGAVTWDGKVFLNKGLVERLGLTEEDIQTAVIETKRNIQDRLQKFRGNKPMPRLAGQVVILVDDGLASGFTMLVATRSVGDKAPQKIVVAVPTASLGAVELLTSEVNQIVCLNIRSGSSFAVADAYVNWHDLTDEEVQKILKEKQPI